MYDGNDIIGRYGTPSGVRSLAGLTTSYYEHPKMLNYSGQ